MGIWKLVMRAREILGWIALGLACAVASGAFASRMLSPAFVRLPRGFPLPLPAAADPLDGEPVPAAVAARRPIGIIVDNHPGARPQWGLGAASRVYEAVTEGGITRYLAVFGPQDADRVGPIRSVRTQFLDYALELNAVVAHVGGNADALDLIPRLHIMNLDEFRYAGAFHRVIRPGVAYEHTTFTSTAVLRALAARAGAGDAPPADAPLWKDDAPRGRRPAAARATIDFSIPAYRVSWVYRPDSNDYARLLTGAPAVDAATGSMLAAKVIAIAAVPRTHGRTRIGEDTWTFLDLGSGRAWVLEDGAVIPGEWHKASPSDRLRFFDESGREIAFDRGPEWIEVIPPEVAPAFE